MKKLLILLGVSTTVNLAYSQDFGKNTSQPMVVKEINKKESTQDRLNRLLGTFQVISKDGVKVMITSELLDLVETSRLESQSVNLIFSPTVDLFILSKEEISSPDFQKLPLEPIKN